MYDDGKTISELNVSNFLDGTACFKITVNINRFLRRSLENLIPSPSSHLKVQVFVKGTYFFNFYFVGIVVSI
jgi:hypothetical protein